MGNRKSTFRRVLTGVGLAIALVLSFGIGWVVGRLNPPAPIVASTPAERAALNLRVFDAVWTRVDREFYDQSFGGRDWDAIRDHYRPRARASRDTAELYYGVLAPMLNTLGVSHLRAMPPLSHGMKPNPGSRVPRILLMPIAVSPLGVARAKGLVIVRRANSNVVAQVYNHSPAEQAGVEPGWRALAFRSVGRSGDLEMRFLTPDRGPVDVVLRGWWRSPPRMPYGKTSLADGVRVLRFDNFRRETIDWVLAEITRAPGRGVILDLRSNHGGPVRQNRRLMAALLAPGSPTQVVEKDDGRRLLRTPKNRQIYTGPLALLVGPESASSAEVVAAAVAWNRRGPVVGGRSAGALLTSRNWRLPDGGRIHVAVQDFRGPDGRRIEGVGVPPTLPVAQTLAAIRQDRDLVIEAADRALNVSSRTSTPEP